MVGTITIINRFSIRGNRDVRNQVKTTATTKMEILKAPSVSISSVKNLQLLKILGSFANIATYQLSKVSTIDIDECTYHQNASEKKRGVTFCAVF